MDKIKQGVFSTIWMIVYAFILFCFSFFISKVSITDLEMVWHFLTTEGYFFILLGFFFYSFLIILSLMCIFKAIFKNNFISNLIVTIIVVLITVVSYYKYSILEMPFVPTDIMLAGTAGQIATFGITFPPIYLIVSVILLVIMLAVQYYIEKKNNISYKVENWRTEIYRIPLFLLGMMGIYAICISSSSFIKEQTKYTDNIVYSFGGAVTSFFIHLYDLVDEKPEGYSKDKIAELKEKYTENENNLSDENVNVILIINEAFSDPTEIKNVTYSLDPLIDIKNLVKNDRNSKMGACITPVIGGGTSIPEFEVLTGISSYYFEKEIFPFLKYINSNVNSLIREYNKNGYKTTGMHTNTNLFYNREGVYQNLGFTDSVFKEDISNPIIKGNFIGDEEMKNQIIKNFENNKGTNKFIFGVTMQNHMPYEDKEYKSFDIKAEGESYSEEDMNELNNYVQGVYDANKMYIELVEYLKSYEEPTILFMFGDHLPALAEYLFYEDSNYNEIKFYETPYIIWSNYGENLNEFPEKIGTSNIGISLFEMSGNQLPWYLNIYKELYNKYFIFNNQFVYNKEMEKVKIEDVEQDELVKNGRILQYELLVKKNMLE